jgi:hypothetical protein
MMFKKWGWIVFLAVSFFPLCVFAQSAKIVDISGKVMVRTSGSSTWGKAEINMLLDKNAELETKGDSYCTLAFDEEQRNIVTLKQNSRIRIDSVRPGDIFMPEGRVFSYVKNLAKDEKFQVRTPTAIAGARGTGWATGYDGIKAQAQCFDETVYVQGLDSQGRVTEETDLSSGNGVDTDPLGGLGEPYRLNDDSRAEWNDFKGYCGDLSGQDGRGDSAGAGESGEDTGAALSDARDEQRDDARENTAEERTLEDSHESNSEGEFISPI